MTAMLVPFFRLSDELVLPIIGHLVLQPRYDRDAYGGLISLALTHRRFTNLARGALQQTNCPTIALSKAHALVRILFAFSDWARRIKGLEITDFASKDAPADTYTTIVQELPGTENPFWLSKAQKDLNQKVEYNTVKKRSNVPSRLFDIIFDARFNVKCQNIVRRTELTLSDKRKWSNALCEGHNAAFLALLLTILPSLSTLSLGSSHALLYPMLFIPVAYKLSYFAYMRGVHSDRSNNGRFDPLHLISENESYLRAVFDRMSGNLKALAAPLVFGGVEDTSSHILRPSFRFYRSLEHLTVANSNFSETFRPDMLPRSLRRLTIVDVQPEAGRFVFQLMKHIRDRYMTTMPDLKLIELFYLEAPPSEFEDRVQRLAAFLGIELKTYTPAVRLEAEEVGAQPWKMSREELDEVTRKDRNQRGAREFAGHWVSEASQIGP